MLVCCKTKLFFSIYNLFYNVWPLDIWNKKRQQLWSKCWILAKLNFLSLVKMITNNSSIFPASQWITCNYPPMHSLLFEERFGWILRLRVIFSKYNKIAFARDQWSTLKKKCHSVKSIIDWILFFYWPIETHTQNTCCQNKEKSHEVAGVYLCSTQHNVGAWWMLDDGHRNC